MNLHRLDLFSISLFAQIARTGSISKGSALAGIAVGAASKRITDLETAVGAPLFERHSRGVALTGAGKALQTHAQRLLRDVDQLEAELSDFASGLVGVVRLWANTSAVTQFLPADLASFVAASPGIRIELTEQNSGDIAAALLDGRADVGILADRVNAPGVQLLNYREDRLALVVPRGHALARRRSLRFEEAAHLDFVSLSEGTSLAQRLHTESEALGKRLKMRIQVRSFDAMCQMVAAGLGVAVLPRDAVRPHLASMKLREIAIDDDWARRRLLIGLRDPNAVPRHVRTLIDHLYASVPRRG